MSRRLSVIVGERDYAELERIAASGGTTVSDVVRESLKVGVWYQREVKPYPERRLLLQRGVTKPRVIMVVD